MSGCVPLWDAMGGLWVAVSQKILLRKSQNHHARSCSQPFFTANSGELVLPQVLPIRSIFRAKPHENMLKVAVL